MPGTDVAPDELRVNRVFLADDTEAQRAPKGPTIAQYIVVMLLAATVRWIFLNGPAGSDDTRYMRAAITLARGEHLGYLDHANVRATFLVWLAAWGRMGLDASQLVLSQIAVAAAEAGALLWVAQMLTDVRSALIATALWICYPVELAYGGVLTPDQFSLSLALISLGLVIRGLETRDSPKLRDGALAGCFVGLSYSAKEPFILLSVVYGVWSLSRIGFGARTWRWYASLLAGFVGILALEHAFFALWAGDWRYKYHALAAAYGDAGSERFPVTLHALTYYVRFVLADFDTSGLYGWLLAAGVLTCLSGVRHKGLIVLWSVVFFLFLQFGSSGIHEYKLLPMQSRYVGPIIVLLFVPLGLMVSRLAANPPLRGAGTLIVMLAIVLQGATVARARITEGLYHSALPASAVALEKVKTSITRLHGRLFVPAGFHERLPIDLRRRAEAWQEPRPELSTSTALESLATSCPCVIFLPADDIGAQAPDAQPLTRTGDRLTAAGATVTAVEGPVTQFDEFLSRAPVQPLRARSQTRTVGHLYQFTPTGLPLRQQ